MNQIYPHQPSKQSPAGPIDLPAWNAKRMLDPAHYLRDPGLVDAVNVALILRQPLMVTGEPGSGKTVLAASIAWELGLTPPLVFETKSTSQARNLFYEYDALGRFTSQGSGNVGIPASHYLSFNALGQAILRTNKSETISEILPGEYAHLGQMRSVVLIDEIEKAPRDFPNDILNEIERMYFRIPELGNVQIEADPDYYPIVVMTNNSEKSLPDAFLRRCIYYNIPFPDEERLNAIMFNRLGNTLPESGDLALARDAVRFAIEIRDERVGIEKKPGTAEILNWISAMVQLGADPNTTMRDSKQSSFAVRSLSALAKIGIDQEITLRALKTWCDGGQT
ncbi:AAA family ATPase [Rhizobium leguminosarum]|uniref:AAA family ATPase n=1 Tax=Rhizobium leguminosarum TaxID=384 RepID=UPI003F97BB9E